MDSCAHEDTRYQVIGQGKDAWLALVCNDCGAVVDEIPTLVPTIQAIFANHNFQNTSFLQ